MNIIPQDLAIVAFKNSGYKSTTHALAELIDNSVEAGQNKGQENTDIEIICIDKYESRGCLPKF